MAGEIPVLPAEDLLAHASFLRRLARALVDDPNASEDLVQEAWLAALRQPPATDRPPRRWLAAVLRNLNRRRARADFRRSRREAAIVATQPTEAEAAEPLLERL